MCNFKSGVILRTRCVIAEGDNDSHSDLLSQLGIEDTTENAIRKFVRAELIPPDNEWWTDPESWKFHVDQDIVPEWFENDKVRYEQEFRAAVTDWWHKHCLIDQKIDELKCGYYRLLRCEVKRLLNNVKVLLGSSTVQDMWDSSTVQDMLGSSTVVRDINNNIIISSDRECQLIRRQNGGSE